ncbi:hypothetical protein CAPTEDRAFT_202859 [Capitella teleta]|uniref:Uncharacterized protein n=1 Tax=Capitella teleta TaxID=283909 RepID=R7UJ30_CAPTE|nr:hypothetical protein CAPTEDRAFT_202859 [Capitella teleta]|eukprot:ELU06073.1 hypothetical protein CAPTEDRAFT_202859 [Capitella teleta]
MASMQDDRDSQAHRQAVHEYHDNIVNACIRAAEATIPHTKRRGRTGWKRHAEPQKKYAILWNRIWKESGSPNTGIIHSIRKTTRAEYRRASRWVVRNEEKLKADKMTDTLHSRDFWTEIQRMQRKHTSTTTEMDGERALSNEQTTPQHQLSVTQWEKGEKMLSVSCLPENMKNYTTAYHTIGKK